MPKIDRRRITDPTPWAPKPAKPAEAAKPGPRKAKAPEPPFEPARAPTKPPPWTDFTAEELMIWPPRGEPEPDDVIAGRLRTFEQRWRYLASLTDSVTIEGEKAVVEGARNDLATIRSVDTRPSAAGHRIEVSWIEVYKRRRQGQPTDFKLQDAYAPEIPAPRLHDPEPKARPKPRRRSSE